MTAHGTVAALIDAAEVEFAERGIEGASLRAIMRAAGANPAAVHYHFGSRNELLRAVLDRTLKPLNDRRLELLEALQQGSGGGIIALNALLDALIRPDLEAMRDLGRRNVSGTRLVGAIYARPTLFVKAQVEEQFRPVAAMFMPELVRALPTVAPDEIAWRIRWCVFGLLIGVLNADENDAAVDLGDIDTSIRRLVTFAAAGLGASIPQQGAT